MGMRGRTRGGMLIRGGKSPVHHFMAPNLGGLLHLIEFPEAPGLGRRTPIIVVEVLGKMDGARQATLMDQMDIGTSMMVAAIANATIGGVCRSQKMKHMADTGDQDVSRF